MRERVKALRAKFPVGESHDVFSQTPDGRQNALDETMSWDLSRLLAVAPSPQANCRHGLVGTVPRQTATDGTGGQQIAAAHDKPSKDLRRAARFNDGWAFGGHAWQLGRRGPNTQFASGAWTVGQLAAGRVDGQGCNHGPELHFLFRSRLDEKQLSPYVFAPWRLIENSTS